MAVHYKFKSAKGYDSVAVEGHFITVGNLKEKIFELKHLGKGTDFDLVVTNAQSNEEYLDEGSLIPKNTSVLIRRVPGRPRKPIVTAPVTEQEVSIVGNNSGDNVQAVKDNLTGAQPSAMKYSDDLDWDEFGNDLYAIPEPVSVQSSVPVQDSTPVSKEDEDSMIKAFIDTPALDWQRQPSDSFGPGRGFGRNMGGRNMGGRGFGRGGFENKKPPEGYICHRCKVPGHFIQHCPTNGDPTFDVKRFKPPTGIPKSMLIATPDGSYALPSGAVAVMKPNLDTFEKDMPSTRSVGELPPELHCPICKEVMKDAVLTSKCCFTSFCDKCIRDHIISKSMCVCGATSILADDLLPNKTLRDTINRILESNNSSDENGGRTYQVQDMESRNPQAKPPSPTQSAASRGQQQVAAPAPQREETSKIHELVEEEKAETSNIVQKQENGTVPKVPDVSEATHDSRGVKEAASHGSAQLVEEEVHQKPTSGDAGKKKKKKKTRMNPGEADTHWRNGQELAPENYMMPMGPSGFNPYWNGMQPGFDGFMPPPFHPGPMPPYMGYGPGPMDIPFGGGMMPHDPFGAMGGMMPYGPPPVQRDLAELAMGFHARPPVMSREQFEARKADLKRKREMERHRERELSKDRDYGREVNSGMDGSPVKSKSKSSHRPSSDQHHRTERHSSPDRRSRDPELPRPSSKKKSERDHSHEDDVYKKRSSDRDHSRNEDSSRHHRSRDHDADDRRHRRSGSSQRSHSEAQDSDALAAAEKKQKASVFSRISFPENESAPKRRKVSSSASESVTEPSKSSHKAAAVSNGYPAGHSKKSSAVADMDHDSSDDERHFKRRPSRYTSSPPPEVEEEEGTRHVKGSRERERDRGYSKYR